MFEGEKASIFWIGLCILGFASTFILFSSLWNIAIFVLRDHGFSQLQYQIPTLVEGIAFTLIGLYMMKSGIKKKK